MSKVKIPINADEEPFGTRLARLRQAAGYSQRDLARESGISQRMIAYYEKQPQYPPVHVLSQLAEALGVPADQLFTATDGNAEPKSKDMRLWKRLEQIEVLAEKDKRQVIQLLDTFIENNRLKRQATGG